MVACIVVPIIANGFRALGIVLLAHFSDNRLAVGADHLVYGWGFSVVILTILMFVGSRFSDSDEDLDSILRRQTSNPDGRLYLPSIVAIIVIGSGYPAAAAMQSRSATPLPVSHLTDELAQTGWRKQTQQTPWQPLFSDPDARVEYERDSSRGPESDLLICYYSHTANGHGIVSSTNKLWDEETWHVANQRNFTLLTPVGSVPAQEVLLVSARQARLVWWSYWADDRFTLSATARVKLSSLKSLFSKPSPTAFVALSTAVESDQDTARNALKEAVRTLEAGPLAGVK